MQFVKRILTIRSRTLFYYSPPFPLTPNSRFCHTPGGLLPGSQVALWTSGRVGLQYPTMKEPVQLLITCLADTFAPQVGTAVVRVLRRLGLEVALPPGQTCCGQPAFNAGLRDEARRMARHTIRVLEGAPGPVVLPSGSCTAMITHGYLELFDRDPEWLRRARALAARTYEFSQFLVDELGVTDPGARCPESLTYHPSCHLMRDLGVDSQPRALLAAVDSAKLVELPEAETCCGFGGLFSVEYDEISAAMLARKMAALDESGAPVLVTCDTGCLLHIYGGLQASDRGQEVRHLAEILAESPPAQAKPSKSS